MNFENIVQETNPALLKLNWKIESRYTYAYIYFAYWLTLNNGMLRKNDVAIQSNRAFDISCICINPINTCTKCGWGLYFVRVAVFV